MTDDKVFAYLVEMNPVADPDSLDTSPALTERELQAASTMSPSARHVSPTRHGWLIAAAVAAVILLFGFGSLALLSLDDDVAEPSDPTVTFDGQSCTYEGPKEFPLGEERFFLGINTSEVRVEVQTWRTTDGTTIDDVNPNAIGLSPKLGPVNYGKIPPGEQVLVRARSNPPVPDEEGPWIVACFSPWGAEPRFEYLATVIEVTGN